MTGISFQALRWLLEKLLKGEGIKIDLTTTDIATETTLSGIKAQTDKLTFDASNRLYVRQGSRDGDSITVANAQDISAGVTAELPPMSKWTLFLHAGGAVDVDIYLSPDGSTWFKIPESPVSFAGEGDEVIEFGYVAKAIKLVGSNSTPVTAMIYYVV